VGTTQLSTRKFCREPKGRHASHIHRLIRTKGKIALSNCISLETELRHPTLYSTNPKDSIGFKVQFSCFLHQLAELYSNRADNDKLIQTGIRTCFEP
jgi:hypothetical protein